MSSFRWGERPGSREQATSTSEVREYWASGSSDPNFVRAESLLFSPSALIVAGGTLYRQATDIGIKWESSDYAIVTVPYGIQNKENGSIKVSYDTTGGTINIKAAKEHIKSYPDDNNPHKGAIGVNGDNVDGADIIIPALKINVAYRAPKGQITMAQIKKLARNTGKTNSDTFMTFEPGEVLFLGGSGSDGTDADVEGNYQFACSENAEGLTIGEIADVVKKGHHVAWVEFKDAVVAGGPGRQAKAVHVERVYEETSFASLFGFG